MNGVSVGGRLNPTHTAIFVTDSPPENADQPAAQKTPGKRKRLLRQAIKLGIVLSCVFILVALSGAWLAYWKRTGILNAIFAEAAAPYRIAAGKFDIDAGGNLDFYDVRLESGGLNGDTGAIITIPHASGVIDFRDALDGKFVSIAIRRPMIQIPFEMIMSGDAPAGLEAIDEEVSTIAPAFASPQLALDDLSIVDAELRIGDALSAKFDHQADALAVYEDGTIESRRHKLVLRDVRFVGPADADGEPDEWVTVPSADAEFSMHRDGGIVQLHSLEIPKATLATDSSLIQWLVDAGFGPFLFHQMTMLATIVGGSSQRNPQGAGERRFLL